VIFPMGILLYDALGGSLMTAIAILIGIFATLVAPLFARFKFASIVTVLAIVFALIACFVPAYTAKRPRLVSLAYVDDVAMPPMFATNTLTPSIRQAAHFEPINPGLVQWTNGRQFSTNAPHEAIPRVEVMGARERGRVLLRIRSPRHANRISLIYRGGTITRVNGVMPPARPARFRESIVNGWHFAAVHATDETVVELESPRMLEIVVSDTTYGLPASAAALMHARDASPAVPVHEGDVTITRTRMKL